MITTYVAQDSPERARALRVLIMERCALLQGSPALGRPRSEFGIDVRSLPLRPLVILYRVGRERQEVEVLRIIDGRRDIRTIFTEGL